MEPLRTLVDSSESVGGSPLLSDHLSGIFGGNVAFPDPPSNDRPYVITNFVSSVDGVVSYRIPGHAGGGDISGFYEADAFSMAVLRACSDAILIGANTLSTEGRQPINAASLYPAEADEFARLRERLGKRRYPLCVVLTGSGSVDLTHPVFHTPELEAAIITTDAGSRVLETHLDDVVTTHVLAMGDGHLVNPSAALQILQKQWNVRLCLCEGGPETTDGFIRAGLVDELFLTLSPRIVGQDIKHPRPSFSEVLAYTPDTSPALTLLSLKSHGSYLFCRYRFEKG
ncbi:MAG TPA: dihydrofolate reductase family protein [Armatimonadota bacterium]|nr:dihydrofolate reductase family protein [Armatimonadota bacterium]